MYETMCLSSLGLVHSTLSLLASPEPTAFDTGMTTIVLAPGTDDEAVAALTVTVVGLAVVDITFPLTLCVPALDDRTIRVVVAWSGAACSLDTVAEGLLILLVAGALFITGEGTDSVSNVPNITALLRSIN